MVILGLRSKPREIGGSLFLSRGIESTEADHQVAQGSHVSGSMSGADRGSIFAEGNVTHIMNGIFDGPVAPAGNLDLSGVELSSRSAGEEDFGFLAHAHGFELMGGTKNHRGLGGVRKAGGLGSDFKGIDLTGDMPAVCLVQSYVWRGKKRPFGLGKGGPVSGIAWVDWL